MTDSNRAELIRKLDTLIRRVAPDAQKVPKYGGTLYTLKPEEKEGQFCGVFPYKSHVQLAFSHGTALEDANNLLEGTGKYRRHLNFSTLEDVACGPVEALLREAADYSVAH